jgi:hypothetical protein
MSMGILMNYQQQPVFGHNPPNINQDGDRLGAKVTECVNSKNLRQRSGKNLNGRLFPGMKTTMTGLKTQAELCVDRLNVLTDPATNGVTDSPFINQTDHFWG